MSRLEKIKQHQYDGYTIWDMGEDNLVWLIEQAERVQELEEDSKDAKFAIDMLQAENQRYKQALEEIVSFDDLVDILYVDKIEIREFVRKSLDKDNTINSMAHIIKVKNKEMRELSDFLKERNIPLKELSPLVTIMSYVRELEKDYEYLSHHFGLETEQNECYREVIKKAIDDLENECLWDALVALKELEGEE